MVAPTNQGKTLWEMLKERMSGNGAGIPFRNPLDWRVESGVVLAAANGPDFAGYDFSVREIREYNRHIGGQDFGFTDYVLAGTNTTTFNPDDALMARVRAVPNAVGGSDCLLLRLYDEISFDPTFLEVVKDTTGRFEINDEVTHSTEEYTRVNNVLDSYHAAVLVIGATTPDGKAANAKATSAKLEYWDYWRDADIGGGRTAKQFVFVEMDSETGWFQIWRGGEFFR